MIESTNKEMQIKINADTLSTIIKGNLSDFYNQVLTCEIVDSLTKRLVENFEKFLNTEIKE